MFHWRPRPVTSRVILHGGPGDYDYLLAQGRRMGLLAVGYHFVIDTLGGVTSGRSLEAIGSHTPRHNEDSVGVWLTHPFSEAQRKALAGLTHRLECLYGPVSLVGHKELPRTRSPKCPALDMDDLRSFIRKENHDLTPAIADLSTQQQLIVNYMRAGHTLSTQIAMVSLGIQSLSSRVAELRALGFDITDEQAKDYHGRSYKKYTLREPARRSGLLVTDDIEPAATPGPALGAGDERIHSLVVPLEGPARRDAQADGAGVRGDNGSL